MAASQTQWQRTWANDRDAIHPTQAAGTNLNPHTTSRVPPLRQEIPEFPVPNIGVEGREPSDPGRPAEHSPFALSSEWNRYSGYIKDARPTNYYSIPAAPVSNKRPCLEVRATADTDPAFVPITSGVHGNPGLGLQSGTLPRLPNFEIASDGRPGTFMDHRSHFHELPIFRQPAAQGRYQKDVNNQTSSGHESPNGESNSSRLCPTCVKASDVAPRIAKGLERLRGQLKIVLAHEKVGHLAAEGLESDASIDPPPEKLLEALDWSMERLNETTRAAQDMLTSRTTRAAENNRKVDQDEPLCSQTAMDRVKSRWEQDDRFGQRGSLGSPSASEDGFKSQELPSIFGKERRSSFTALQPQSPTQVSMPNRGLPSLPSPASLNFSTTSNVLPSISPSISGSGPRSPRTAHLQDLQHQLSTRTLAYQILQGEHEKLMAALTRSQTRYETLNRKSQVSDAEINNLTEDRIRLQSELEVLEQQVEDLQQSRDDAYKETMSSGSQYMQIVARSSKLEAQSAVELKKWKADRDSWAVEKEELLARIHKLETSSAPTEATMSEGHRSNITLSDTASVLGTRSERNTLSQHQIEAALTSMSPEQLITEILRLRAGKSEADLLITAYREESEKLGGVRGRMKELDLRVDSIYTEPR